MWSIVGFVVLGLFFVYWVLSLEVWDVCYLLVYWYE